LGNGFAPIQQEIEIFPGLVAKIMRTFREFIMDFESRLDEAFGIQTPMKTTLFERKLEELDWRKAIGAAGMGLAALGGAGGEAGAAPAPVGQAQQLDAPIKPKTADEKAEELVKPLREAYDKEVKVAQDKYNKILAVELDKATKAGSLDDVKAIKKEMEEPEGDESRWKSPTHKMAAKRYTGEVETAKKKWDVGIAGLVRQLVQKKELEVAEKVKGMKIVAETPRKAEGNIVGTWVWFDNRNAIFDADGTVRFYAGDGRVLPGKWTVMDDRIRIEWAHGPVDFIILDGEKTAKVVNAAGDLKFKSTKLDRPKNK